MSRIFLMIIRLFLMPVCIVVVVFVIISLLAYGGQPLRDIGNGIERGAKKINRCLHRAADRLDGIKELPEEANKKIRKLKEGL